MDKPPSMDLIRSGHDINYLARTGILGMTQSLSGPLTGKLAMAHAPAKLGGKDLEPGHHVLCGTFPCNDVYKTLDGRFITVGALEPKFGTAWTKALGVPDLSAQAFARGKHGKTVKQKPSEIFASKTAAEWKRFLEDKDLMCEVVQMRLSSRA
jgi:crotonobetainyl-CoA:carnitine CoA-transferase CaiB-like acyl-CoA transferase